MAIRVFFATNRAGALPPPVGDAARLEGLRFGEARLAELGDPLRTEAERDLLEITETGALALADPRPSPAAGAALAAWLAEAGVDGVPLLWLHGFANGLEGVLRRAAQIVEFYAGAEPGVRLVPLVCAWPSLGVTLGRLQGLDLDAAAEPYRTDQDPAMRSGPAMARLLQEVLLARAAAGAPGRRLALLAHSMGNWVLHHALSSFAPGWPAPADRLAIRHAVLIAADIDQHLGQAGTPLLRLADLARAVTIGTNVDPVLETVSGLANGGGRRLGHVGPGRLEGLPGHVAVVDCLPGINAVDRGRILAAGGTEWDSIHHQYYRNNQNVRAHLAAAFAGDAARLEQTRQPLAAADRLAREPLGDLVRARTHVLLPSIFDIAGPP